ncbi:MAG: hypothetical protein U1D30_24565 [Planctomycetota bacterium]
MSQATAAPSRPGGSSSSSGSADATSDKKATISSPSESTAATTKDAVVAADLNGRGFSKEEVRARVEYAAKETLPATVAAAANVAASSVPKESSGPSLASSVSPAKADRQMVDAESEAESDVATSSMDYAASLATDLVANVPQWLADSLASFDSTELMPAKETFDEIWSGLHAEQAVARLVDNGAIPWLVACAGATALVVRRRKIAVKSENAWLELAPGCIDDAFAK